MSQSLAPRLLLLVILAGFSSVCLASGEDGSELFEKKCSLCHKLPDPANPPEEGWEKRLDLMAPLARLKKKEKTAILEFLLSHPKEAVITSTMEVEKTVFEQKCSLCHSTERALLESFDSETGDHILHRMQEYAGREWISDDDLTDILAYLKNKDSVVIEKDSIEQEDGRSLFYARCSACHSLERVFSLLAREEVPAMSLMHLVTRMQEKAPQWISAQESEQILQYLQDLEDQLSGVKQKAE